MIERTVVFIPCRLGKHAMQSYARRIVKTKFLPR